MEKYYTYLNVLVVVFFLGIMLIGSSNENEITPGIDIPCQNLDVLDSVEEILHWEIINDTLQIYTIQDSINDEIERWNYIRSIEDEDVWE
jgi:hypothetical protein